MAQPKKRAPPAPPDQSQPDVRSLLAVSARLEAEVNRRRWLADPVVWVTERLGEQLWSKQREIMQAVRDYRLVSVPSGHGTGKSFLAARLACWWIDTHPPGEAFVVTTASSWRQVEAVLWRELRRAHTKGNLPGRTNRTEWLMPIVGTSGDNAIEELVAIGHRPADTDPTGFHGIHAPYVLVIVDEAGSLPKILWEALDSLVSNEDSRFLAIGNPDDPTGEFEKVSRPESGWHTIHISVLDTPVYTNERIDPSITKQLSSRAWVEEKRRRWGESNPQYIARVLGQFPSVSEDGLIPVAWIVAAQERWESCPPSHPIELGVDVGAGGDKNVIAIREGKRVRVLHDDSDPDTINTAKRVMSFIRRFHPEATKIDAIGIGRGAVDYIKMNERALAGKIVGVHVGSAAQKSDAFANLRAEGFWHLRELFQDGEIAIDPKDEELSAQLKDLRYEPTSGGRIIIESKESMKRRGLRSPDRADAVMLACIPTRRRSGVTWGRKPGQHAVAPAYGRYGR